MIGCLNDKFIAIEVKRPTGGKPTPVQIKNLQQIANNGGLAFISNDPMLPQKIYQNNLNDKSIIQATTPTNTLLSPKEATKLWNQAKDIHTIWIRKGN